MVVQMVVLGILLWIIPTIVGMLFVQKERGMQRVLLGWVSGQVVLWAAFLVVSIPLILLEKTFTMVTVSYSVLVAGLLLVSVVTGVLRRKKNIAGPAVEHRQSKATIALWAVFAVLLLLQLVLSICLAYDEGDDAFYIAISTATESTEYMYRTLPYSGLTTQLDARHGLAPFPIWIAYLARMSGMATVTVAQIVVPWMILLLAYAIYYLLARQLLAEKEERIPFFMILVELMVMFGGYSLYSAENFLLVRASQGKAVIANVILPFMVYLFFLLAEKLQEKARFGVLRWSLLSTTMMAGCLCSTLGTLLTVMMLGIIGLCMVICYRNWKIIFPLAVSCVVPGALALLYFVLR